MTNIFDIAARDAKTILNDGLELTLTPQYHDCILINGWGIRHTGDYDTDGLPILAPNIHCTFVEKDINDKGIATRDGNGNLIIKNWVVSWKDQSGEHEYKIAEPYPDAVLGLIRCNLVV